MSLTDLRILPRLYDGLATPPLSPTNPTSPSFNPTGPGATAAAKRRGSTSRRTSFALPGAHTVPISPTILDTPAPAIRANPLGDIPEPSFFAIPPPAHPLVPIESHSFSRSLQPSRIPHLVPTNTHNHNPTNTDPLSSYPYLDPVTPNFIATADSLTREKKGKMPALSHLLSVGNGRVLALAADERYVYAGCQSADNEVMVFSRASLQPLFRLMGHEGSILALMVVPEKHWLVSSSSAGDIRIWCTKNLEPVYIIHPCDDTAGDIYSLAWDNRCGGTLYFGTQSTSLEYVNFGDTEKGPTRKRQSSIPASSASMTVPVNAQSTVDSNGKDGDGQRANAPPIERQRTGRYRPHKFFENPPTLRSMASGANSGASTPKISKKPAGITDVELQGIDLHKTGRKQTVEEIEVPHENRLAFAHYGYIYALHVADRHPLSRSRSRTKAHANGTTNGQGGEEEGEKWLISGSGDSDVKVWLLVPGGGLHLLKVFEGLSGAVMSFVVRDSLLYAGLQDGEILVWDLETSACIRTIEAHESDVLTMCALGGDVYSAAADGRVLRFNDEFDCTAAFRGHKGNVLSCVLVKGKERGWDLITAGSDSYVKIWNVDLPKQEHDTDVTMEGEGDVMLYALSKLIAVPTVSDEAHRESCRQGAHLLRKLLSQLGAETEVLSTEQGRNPLVLATFSSTTPSSSSPSSPSTSSSKPRQRLLFYAHYDVQPAAEEPWETNPWELSGRNGYLYGRGVSDNKGPILAVACAASSLRARRELDVDVVLVVEGEEEAGSRGFASCIRRHKNKIGHIDTILLSNSTWINENDPCVVYGMRGVVYANLSISSKSIDAHSGVDGGMVAEPMSDMVRLLGSISSGENGGVALPGFYDNVRPKSQSEMSLLSEVAKACDRPVEDLVKVWREPSFSIANISAGAAGNKTVIPRKVTADISMRIVPDQEMGAIVQGLKGYCEKVFRDLHSPNDFEITVTHSASWWLANLTNPYLQALESAVQDVWGVAPLKIREGGTVPTISFLEQEFNAPCVHLPMGQASDAGHLANERMRLQNLRNGKKVVEVYLGKLAGLGGKEEGGGASEGDETGK